MSIVIEKASPTDAEELLAYLKKVGSETDNLTFGAEGLPFSGEAEAAYLERISSSENEVMLVAKENGKIVGSASLSRLPRRLKHRGDFAVTVLKEHWNKGIGGKLLAGIIEFAKANGFEVLDLQVRSDNSAAIHLYEKFGFTKIGTHPAFSKVDGKDYPADFMWLKLE